MERIYNITYKQKTIHLKYAEILHTIEDLSYKWGETSTKDDAVKDSVQADSEEMLDAAVLSRLVSSRVAELEDMLSAYVEAEEVDEVSNEVSEVEEYTIRIRVPETFPAVRLKTLCSMMHDYVAMGALADWYNMIGTGFGVSMGAALSMLQNKLVTCLKGGILKHHHIIHQDNWHER